MEIHLYLRFPGSLKASFSICYVLFSSETRYFGALLLFHKSFLKPTPIIQFISNLAYLCSDANTHFHIETPSINTAVMFWQLRLVKLLHRHNFFRKLLISNSSRTEWRLIRSVIIRVITKSDVSEAGVRFLYQTDRIGRHKIFILPIILKNYISEKRRIVKLRRFKLQL